MKKLFLFVSILLSCAFSFAAVQKRMVASANSVIYQYDIRAAVAFNKIKEALVRKAWENGTGVLSKEEIKEILDAEKSFLLKEQCMKNFDKPCFPNYVIENSILCGGVGGILGMIQGALCSKKLSLLKYRLVIGICVGLSIYSGLEIWRLIVSDRFFTHWLKVKTLEQSDYQRILDERFTKIRNIPDVMDDFYDTLVGDKPAVNYLFQYFRILYPFKYPTLESLKLNEPTTSEEMQAMQCLVADNVYANKRKRYRNVQFAHTMYELLALPGN